MDPRLLEYYNRELAHVYEMGGEFARQFPAIAGALNLDRFGCKDPYVERLLEGFAFLTARVQLKLDAEFPRFTQHLLESLYPGSNSPIPSMMVVQLHPDLKEGSLAEGIVVPRGSILRSTTAVERRKTEYRTAHDVTLWPLELVEARYFTRATAAAIDVPQVTAATAGMFFRLQCTAGLTLDKLSLDKLPLFLRGAHQLPVRLYEQLIANSITVFARPGGAENDWQEITETAPVQPIGFEENQSLFPTSPRSFSGYRLLREYFAMPERYYFVQVAGLAPVVQRGTSSDLEILVLLTRADEQLTNQVDASNFGLFCTPAINLFPKRFPVELNSRRAENHVVPERERPMDFEVYQVDRVWGHGAEANQSQEFLPFYSLGQKGQRGGLAYFVPRREPRILSTRQKRDGPRSDYLGSEVFISLVDAEAAPYDTNLRHLSLNTLCTNRDLPLFVGPTDFSFDNGAPVESVKCLIGPTSPKQVPDDGQTAWRLISHLSLNYLSLLDSDNVQGAAALRELLGLYSGTADQAAQRQVDGIKSINAAPIVQPLPTPGPITFGRGLEITVTCDDYAFAGTGVFIIGAVLDQFFAKYASINSFTKMILRTTERGEVTRWPARMGRRHII